MIYFLKDNLGTIVVSLILIGIVVLILLKMNRQRKEGKGSCSCGCSACPMSGTCHDKGENDAPKEK